MRTAAALQFALITTLLLIGTQVVTAQQPADRLDDAEIADWTDRLRSRDPVVRGAAIEAISGMGDAAISLGPTLIELLAD